MNNTAGNLRKSKRSLLHLFN